MAPPSPSTSVSATAAPRRAYWLKTLHEWHWVSSALCLIGMLLFSITGITLNHAGQIEAKPQVLHQTATLPPAQREQLAALAGQPSPPPTAPDALAQWARTQWQIDLRERPVEWSADEVYISLPRPGGDAWMRVNPADGQAEYEKTDRGWIAYLNDLHKGRNTGGAWSWFIDIFAAATLLFSITGLLILKMHAGKRPFTWPMVGLGLLAPLLLALLLIH